MGRIVALKLTHDGGAAVLEDGQLAVMIEWEKLANNRRHSQPESLTACVDLLADQGCGLEPGVTTVVDGWYSPVPLDTTSALPVAPYVEADPSELLTPLRYPSLQTSARRFNIGYWSYPHTAGHIAATYCTSPFAEELADSYVLIWDGAILPRLYRVSDQARKIVSLGPLLPMAGNCLAAFASCLPPFEGSDDDSVDSPSERELSLPG